MKFCFPRFAWRIWWCRPPWWIVLPPGSRSACVMLLCSIRQCSATSSLRDISRATFAACASSTRNGWLCFWKRRAPGSEGLLEIPKVEAGLQTGRMAGAGNQRPARRGGSGPARGGGDSGESVLLPPLRPARAAARLCRGGCAGVAPRSGAVRVHWRLARRGEERLLIAAGKTRRSSARIGGERPRPHSFLLHELREPSRIDGDE